ncbi:MULTISPECIES: hypothetical protein [Peribacillus]|uniref:hypothetical protein n=1 Tax=Peribacillus TaxID=2675229 RepID=UPI000BA700DD|nr:MULTISPECIES: hypothetical protein [Peribacillus]MBD8591631.1 hypothetical protein [Peribacillus simplex]MCM3169600.1 hypothetical protein [Peribacillus frigoritolerans]MEE3955735.1 hypothetical protein [Peribacillus frigoritolerans]PAK98879.1 hypothetical protein B8W99_28305 [Peribacillus simplex]
MKINREAFDEFNQVCNYYFEKDANKNFEINTKIMSARAVINYALQDINNKNDDINVYELISISDKILTSIEYLLRSLIVYDKKNDKDEFYGVENINRDKYDYFKAIRSYIIAHPLETTHTEYSRFGFGKNVVFEDIQKTKEHHKTLMEKMIENIETADYVMTFTRINSDFKNSDIENIENLGETFKKGLNIEKDILSLIRYAIDNMKVITEHLNRKNETTINGFE